MNARARISSAVALAVLSLTFVPRAAAADTGGSEPMPLDSSRFAFSQTVDTTGTDAEFFSFALSADHYRACRDDLGDIRIFDSLGAQCPYALDSREVSVSRDTKRIAAAETARGTAGEGDGAVSWREYQVVDFEEPLEVNALSFDADTAEYSVKLEIFARDAKSDWVRVATDTIYRISGVEKTAIELDAIVAYPFWRVESRGDTSPFGMLAVTAVLDRERSESKDFRKETDPAFAAVSKGGRTTIRVENPDRLAVTAVSVEAPGPFRRFVSVIADKRTVARDEVYRIRKGEDEARRTKIVLDRPVRSSEISLVIEDGDDAPLAVSRITAEFAVDRIVFRPTGNPPYRLAFGNPGVERPVYDIRSYRNEIDASRVREAALLTKEETAGFRRGAVDKDAGRTVFSVVVVITALALSAIVVAMLFRQKEAARR